MDQKPSLRRAVAALFLASGMCGLVFEIIWVRQLTLAIGYSTFAVSLVVGAFLLGLVLGSLFFGARADRMARPVRVYAVLELATGLAAAGISLLLSHLPELLGGLPAPLPVRAALAFLLILPPTFLMGGTLPVLSRWVAQDRSQVGRSFAVLYSLNTLGAAVGCGVAGFFLIGQLGLLRTAFVAAGLNGAVAVAAFLLDRRLQPMAVTVPASPGPSSPRTRGLPLLLGAFFVAGFASIAYEVLWFRVLSHFMESSVYVFTLLLVTYLLGLVLGGLWFALRLSGKPNPLGRLAAIEVLVALTALLSVALLGEGYLIRHLVARAGAVGHLLNFAHIALVILLPTTLIGMAFPLVAEITTQRLERIGAGIGLLYSVNTLGGILGSLVVGLALIPAVGTQRSFAIACVLTLAVGLTVFQLEPGRTRRQGLSLWGTAALVLIGIALMPADHLVRGVSSLSGSRLLEMREGRDGTVGIFEFDRQSTCDSPFFRCEPQWCPADFSFRKVTYGSISYAGTIPSGQRYMRLLAHLPMLLHPDPRDVLQVCFGTGSTAASFTRYPGLESLTVVDLNPDVVALAPYFSSTNLDVARHPKAKIVIDDGRRFVTATDARYDVISFEPPPPTAQGAVNLYSQELYRSIRRRLRPGGMLTQWIPLDQQSDLLGRALIKSIQEEFPYVSLWIPSKLEAVILASDQPIPLHPETLLRRFSQPAVRENLAQVGYDSVEEVLGSYLIGTQGLQRYSQGVPPVTDDRPAIEYFAGRGEGFSPGDLLAAAESPLQLLSGEDNALVPVEQGAPLREGQPRPPVTEGPPPGQQETSRTIPAATGSHPSPPWNLDRDAITRSAQAHQALIRAHVYGLYKEREPARAEVRRAEALAGADVYTRYLHDLEYGCLMYLPRQTEP